MSKNKKILGLDWHDEFMLGPIKFLPRVIWLLFISGVLIAPPLLLSVKGMEEIIK
jgi:hypothetical protein